MSIKYAVATTSLNFLQTTNVYLVPFAVKTGHLKKIVVIQNSKKSIKQI